MIPYLPSEVGALALSALSATSFVASFITAAFGLGGGVAMLAVLASVLPPPALIPVHGLVQLASNAGRVATLGRHVQTSPLLPFLAGSVLGAALGGVVAVEIPGAVVQIFVGFFVIWSALFQAPKALRRGARSAGFVSTLLTMFFGATGPFVAAYVKTLNLGRMEHVGTHAAMMTIQHALKVAAFAMLGFAFGPWLVPVAAMAVAGLLGTLAGKQVLTRSTDERFRLILTIILCALGARLIWQGGWDLTGPY